MIKISNVYTLLIPVFLIMMLLNPLEDPPGDYIAKPTRTIESICSQGAYDLGILKYEDSPDFLSFNPYCLDYFKQTRISLGDWIVTGEEVRQDETIVLDGNLIIEEGGSLTLINVTLYLRCTYDGEWQIRVESGGILTILGSKLTAYDPEHEFLFYVYGLLKMRGSELKECGFDWDYPGLWIETDEGVIVDNCTINYNYFGIFCCESSYVLISGCEVSKNRYDGIYCSESSYIFISGCEVSKNGYDGVWFDYSSYITVHKSNISNNGEIGLYCYESSDITISECRISSNLLGIGLYGSSDISLSGCVIRDNRDDGVWCDWSSSIIISCCEISGSSDDGIYCVESSNIIISGSQITQNYDEGIRCDWSDSVKVHYCDIFSNKGHGLYNVGARTVNSTYNWWGGLNPEYKESGDSEDPEEIYSTFGIEYVVYDPWLVERVSEVDSIPPSVVITNPLEESFLAGTVNIKVDARDNRAGIANVVIFIENFVISTDSEFPYEYDWNTKSWPDGKCILKAEACDRAGNKAQQSILVIIDNGAPEIGTPTISPEQPVEGEPLIVRVEVTDKLSGVEMVKLWYSNDTLWFSINMTHIGEDIYEGVITYSRGIRLKIWAKDAAGNEQTSPEYRKSSSCINFSGFQIE